MVTSLTIPARLRSLDQPFISPPPLPLLGDFQISFSVIRTLQKTGKATPVIRHLDYPTFFRLTMSPPRYSSYFIHEYNSGLALIVFLPPFFLFFFPRFPYTLMSTTHCRPHRALSAHIYLLAALIYSLLIHTIFTPISVFFFFCGYLQRTVPISSHDLPQSVSIAHTHGSRIILLSHLCYTFFHLYITFPSLSSSHIHSYCV